MNGQLSIHKALAAASGTGSSFARELRELLWQRSKSMLVIGLAVVLLLQFTERLLLRAELAVETQFALTTSQLLWLHLAALASAGAILAAARRRASARQLQWILALLLGTNLLLAIFGKAACRPFEPAYFAVALLLFLPACYVPWPARFQVGLGATALLGYLGIATAVFLQWPVLREPCAPPGGVDVWRGTIVGGAVRIIILATVATLASHTLYGLRRRVHGAARLGNYVIERELGRGGMGAVYLARHTLICRPTAVKVLEAPASQGAIAMSRFEQEVRVSATLTHPNTIQIHDYGRTPAGVFYYAMEYLEGLDLQRFVERFGPLEPARAIFVLRQVCGSLGEAHARGIVHRDVKPSNIFLTQRGGLYDFVKILDFGLAKELHGLGDSALTKPGLIFGTPRYMAPEAVYGQPLDARSDIYNLGCVAYCLLTGRHLFGDSSSMELIVDHARTVPLRPSAVSEVPLPEDLENVIMRCLEKRPEDRYQSVAELDAALAALGDAGGWDHARAREWWQVHGLAVIPEPTPVAGSDGCPPCAEAAAADGPPPLLR
jgi:tRNA A-37 threonylcarbamoyl transferase component Bud32